MSDNMLALLILAAGLFMVFGGLFAWGVGGAVFAFGLWLAFCALDENATRRANRSDD